MEATNVAYSPERRSEERRRWVAGRPLHHTWRGMIRRCEDPKAKGYEYYGGSGITVCAEWHDYKTFESWVLANIGPRPDGMTLDRINNFEGYKPGNVRWSTYADQNRNRRLPWNQWPEHRERWRLYE